MKAKTHGKAVFIVKTWKREENGLLNYSAEFWINKKDAIKDYEMKEKRYGVDNVFFFKAQQCHFVE